MRGIILAAGKGSRLNGNSGESPKCLVKLGGEPLILRQIETLRRAGIDDIAVVTGCQAQRVREVCGNGITYVENTRYAETNSMYSLWMARPLLFEGFVVLNCDVLFHPALLSDLLTARYEDALLLAYREAHQPPFGDEEMKVKVRCGRVLEMSKELDPAEADGENLGIVKFGADGAALLVDILDHLVEAGGLRYWAPRAFREFAQARALHAIGTRGLPWIEIDFPEDYERAVREVLPEIEADHLTAADDEIEMPPMLTGVGSTRGSRSGGLPAGSLR
jgi:L-glutamine-phosphate cytidylyltransferase